MMSGFRQHLITFKASNHRIGSLDLMSHIITVPAFSDNYIWLICNEGNNENVRQGIIVDPGDPSHLIPLLSHEKIEPIAILITHLHYDHANGLEELNSMYPDIPVYGPESEQSLLIDNPQPATYGPATFCYQVITHDAKHIYLYFHMLLIDNCLQYICSFFPNCLKFSNINYSNL